MNIRTWTGSHWLLFPTGRFDIILCLHVFHTALLILAFESRTISDRFTNSRIQTYCLEFAFNCKCNDFMNEHDYLFFLLISSDTFKEF